jgi:hypothetical protein
MGKKKIRFVLSNVTPNTFGSTMSLGLTQPVTDLSTKNLRGGKGQLERKVDNFNAIYEPIV